MGMLMQLTHDELLNVLTLVKAMTEVELEDEDENFSTDWDGVILKLYSQLHKVKCDMGIEEKSKV